MVLNTMVSEPDKATASSSIVDNTTLAFPTLVSIPSRDAPRLSSGSPTSTESDIEPLQSGVHNAAKGSNIDHMACLRESFTS